MKFEQLVELIQTVSSSNLGEFKYEEGDFKISLKKEKGEDVGNLKGEIQKILQQSTSNILQLLSIFSKIEVFAREDVAVAEYLRIAIYEVLIKRK